MSRPGNQNWTREDSRYVDGELEGEQARRLERETTEGDLRSKRLGAWREAMDLWREDGRRAAMAFDADRVTRRILEASGPREAAPGLAAIQATRRYAAAAVLLIGLGLGGTLWIGPQAAAESPPTVETITQALERDHLDLIADREWDRVRPTGR